MDGHPQGARHGGPRVRVCVCVWWCKTKTTTAQYGRTTATADSKRQPAGVRGHSPAHQRQVPHVPQSNGAGHAPEPTSQTPRGQRRLSQCLNHTQPPNHGDHSKRRPGGRQGTRLAVPLTPRRHSPHATHHYGETWCQHRPPQGLGRDSWQAGLCENTVFPPLTAATEQGRPVPGT